MADYFLPKESPLVRAMRGWPSAPGEVPLVPLKLKKNALTRKLAVCFIANSDGQIFEAVSGNNGAHIAPYGGAVVEKRRMNNTYTGSHFQAANPYFSKTSGDSFAIFVKLGRVALEGTNPGIMRSGSSSTDGNFYIIANGSGGNKPRVKCGTDNTFSDLEAIASFQSLLYTHNDSTNTDFVWQNGIRSASKSATGAAFALYEFGLQFSGLERVYGDYEIVACFNELPTDAEAYTLTVDGWNALFEPAANDTPYLVATSGGTTINQYSMDAVSAGFVLSGQTATLEFDHNLVATQQSYSLTGQAVTLAKTINLDAVSASYTQTNQDAALEYNRVLTAAKQDYTLTGIATNLENDKALVASQQSYVFSPQAADLQAAKALLATQQSYVASMQNFTIDVGGITAPTITNVVASNIQHTSATITVTVAF